MNLTPGTRWVLEGWGMPHEPKFTNERGGMWSTYEFATLREARSEQRKQRVSEKRKKNRAARGDMSFDIFRVTVMKERFL
jgi:hypothetical protein